MEQLSEKTFTTSRDLTYRCYILEGPSSDVSKPPLLLLHGWPDSARLSQYIVPHLQKLPYRILVPDMLGYGGTSKPTDPSLYAGGVITEDLTEILNHENIDKVVSIGHDGSSVTAQRLFLFHPSRVVGLVMLSVFYTARARSEHFDLAAVNNKLEDICGDPLYAYWELFTALDGPKIFDEHLETAWYAQHGDHPNWMKKL